MRLRSDSDPAAELIGFRSRRFIYAGFGAAQVCRSSGDPELSGENVQDFYFCWMLDAKYINRAQSRLRGTGSLAPKQNKAAGLPSK